MIFIISDTAKVNMGKKLKELREAQKLTQAQLGEKVGKALTTVASWENGKSLPDADTLFRLLAFYDVENVLQEFGYKQEKDSFSLNERSLIAALRSMDDPTQKLLYSFIYGLLDISNKNK
ncbi:MAG: helix-turn-helix transcriptional regulator [Oscillospiraceae bacterium]